MIATSMGTSADCYDTSALPLYSLNRRVNESPSNYGGTSGAADHERLTSVSLVQRAILHTDRGTPPESAGTYSDVSVNSYRDEVIPEMDQSARTLVSDRVQAILRRLLPELIRVASGFVDPEEDNRQLVITQWVNLPASPALDYWDRLGAFIESWTASQTPYVRSIVSEQFAFDVRWNA
jgi:hypothetical protein